MYKAHQKVLARVLAKDYLKCIRPNVTGVLKDQGVFRDPSEKALYGHVVPWIYTMTDELLASDGGLEEMLLKLTEGACDGILREHGDALDKERDKRKKKKKEEEEKKEAKRIEKERLKIEREEQKKKDNLKQLQLSVEQMLVEKGEWHNEILKQEMSNLHGNMQGKATVGVLGGILTQMAIALTSAAELSGKADLVTEKSAYILLTTYLSDMFKADHYDVLFGPNMMNIITAKNAKLEELYTLDPESTQSLLQIYKAADFGDELYKLIRSKCQEHGINTAFLDCLSDAIMKLLLKKLTEKDAQGNDDSY